MTMRCIAEHGLAVGCLNVEWEHDLGLGEPMGCPTLIVPAQDTRRGFDLDPELASIPNLTLTQPETLCLHRVLKTL